MEAPSYICKQLADFHPRLRIGWDGASRTFGLVRLLHQVDYVRTLREPWDHGPIFSAKGRPRPDWDMLSFYPIYLIRLTRKDIDYDPLVDGWGLLLKLVKRWHLRPIAARVYEGKMEQRREVDSYIESVADDMASRIYREGQRSGAGAPILAKKFIEPTLNQVKNRSGVFDDTERLLPKAPKGGWGKALENDIGPGDPDDLGSISGVSQ